MQDLDVDILSSLLCEWKYLFQQPETYTYSLIFWCLQALCLQAKNDQVLSFLFVPPWCLLSKIHGSLVTISLGWYGLCGSLLFSLISEIRMSDQKHILSPRIQAHCGCWEMSTIRISSLTAVVFNASHGACVPTRSKALPVSLHLGNHLSVGFL